MRSITFRRGLVAVIHTVLTDNGKHFTTLGNTSSAAPDIRAAIEAGEPIWAHAFEHACARLDIDHRLTKPKHPWTNGQVERMNRALKDAIVKRYYYETHDQLRTHLGDFVTACDFARRLKDKGAATIQSQSGPSYAGTKTSSLGIPSH
jgi:transposase InsO family protein